MSAPSRARAMRRPSGRVIRRACRRRTDAHTVDGVGAGRSPRRAPDDTAPAFVPEGDMLRLWVESYRERPTAWGRASALLSVAAHTVLIGAFVEATRAPEGVEPQHALANRVFFIPPPNRIPSQ